MVKGVKPTQHSRPSINLGGPKREWKDIPANEIRVDDMVVDVGKVTEVELRSETNPPRLVIVVTNVSEQVFTYPGEFNLMARTLDSSWVFPTVKAFVEV